MVRRDDPRIRQTINQISHNLESANESAQESLYAFSQNYVLPCFAAIGNCVYTCAAPCLPTREDRLRRRRRGRAEANFDFYDDWDNEPSDDGFLGWGNDELDRLLAGRGLARGGSDQPKRQRAMSYGTRGPRRRSSVLVPNNRHDPTVIPSSSFLGFLERFPWRFGARGLKYRPSAADLQENPGGRHYIHEEEPLMEATDEGEDQGYDAQKGRDRSATQSSRETANSLSSRGDLIPSDEEEDAVPLDDEFAITLGPRGASDADDQQGRQSGQATRSNSGTLSSKTTSSSRTSGKKNKKGRRQKSPRVYDAEIIHDADMPSLSDLKKEEAQAALEEELNITKRRRAAQKLALRRGLDREPGKSSSPFHSARSPATSPDTDCQTPLDSVEKTKFSDDRDCEPSQPSSVQNSQTEPFPPLPLTPPVTGLPRVPPVSQCDSQRNSSRSSGSIDRLDPSAAGPGEQPGNGDDDVD